MNITEIRAKYPQYADVGDQELVGGLHKKFYSDIPEKDFYAKVGVEPPKPKHGIVDAFKGAGARVAQGVNSAAGAMLTSIGADQGAEAYKQGADYWAAKAEKAGSSGVPAQIYEGLGGAPQGIAQFVAGVPYAAAKGGLEGFRKDGAVGALEGAGTEALKRFAIGKVFKGIERANLTPVGKSGTMAGTMGAQTAAEGGSLQDVVASTVTGAALMPPTGGGRSGVVRQRMQRAGASPEVAMDLSGRGAADAIPQGPGFVTAERDPRVFSDTQGQPRVADSERSPTLRPDVKPPVADSEQSPVFAEQRPAVADAESFNHDALPTAAVKPADSLSVPASVKVAVVGTPAEIDALPRTGRVRVDHDGKSYLIDHLQAKKQFGSVKRAAEMLRAGGDEAGKVLGYPPREGVTDLQTAAVTKAGEVLVEPEAIKQAATAGEVAYAAEGAPEQLAESVGKVAEAMVNRTSPQYINEYINRVSTPLEANGIKVEAHVGAALPIIGSTPVSFKFTRDGQTVGYASRLVGRDGIKLGKIDSLLPEGGKMGVIPHLYPAERSLLADHGGEMRVDAIHPQTKKGIDKTYPEAENLGDSTFKAQFSGDKDFTSTDTTRHDAAAQNTRLGEEIHGFYERNADNKRAASRGIGRPTEGSAGRSEQIQPASAGRAADGLPVGGAGVASVNRGQAETAGTVTPGGQTGRVEGSTGENSGRGQEAERVANSTGKSASEWATQMAELQKTKPRPLDKLYGSKGPTPEQAAEHLAKMREWNKAHRNASKNQKIALEEDNAAFRAQRDSGDVTLLHAGVHLPTLVKQAKDLITHYTAKLDRDAPAGSVKEFLDANREANTRFGTEPAMRVLRRALIDASGNVQNALMSLGDRGEFVRRQFDSISGSSAKAQLAVEKQREALKGMSLREQQAMGDLVAIDRDLAITKPGYVKIGGKTDAELAAARASFQQDYKLTDAEMQRVDDATKAYFKAWKDNTQRMLDGGLIDATQKQALDKQDYSPKQFLEHIDPDIPGTSGRITVPDSGIKRLKQGSDQYFRNNPMRLLSEATARIETRIARNEANQALATLPADNGIWQAAEAPGHTAVHYMENGKQKTVWMKDEFAKEWRKNDPLLNSEMATWLQWVTGAKVVRAMATGYNPAFLFTNTPRDMITVWMQANAQGYSKHAPVALGQMAGDMLKVTGDAWGRKGRYLDYVAQGGGRELLTHEGALSSRRENLSPALAKAQKVLSYVNEYSELLTRLAYRERMIANGADPATASKHAAEYVDFSRGGTVIKAIDRMGIPYLNAAVQGARSVARAAGRDPGAFAYKTAQLMAGVTGLYALNQMTNPQGWANVSDRDKAANFIIMLPKMFEYVDKDGTTVSPYIKVAKEQGMMPFMTVAELATHWANGGKPTPQQLQMALGTALPISLDKLPPTAAALWTYMGNLDTYKKEPVWKGKQEIAPFAEYTNNTNPIFTAVGRATASTDAKGQLAGGISPERLRASMGTLLPPNNAFLQLAGNMATDAWENMHPSDKMEFTKTNYEKLRSTPGISRLLGGAKDTEQFREGIREARVATATGQYEVNKTLDAMVLRYVKGGQTDPALYQRIQDYVGKQSGEARSRLEGRIDDLVDTANLPDRGWWMSVKALQPEDRADQFKARLQKADSQEQQRMLQIANDLPGFRSDRFDERYGEGQ